VKDKAAKLNDVRVVTYGYCPYVCRR